MKDIQELIDMLSSKWRTLIESPSTKPEIAKNIIGGSECRRVISRISTTLEDLANDRSHYHILISGRRGNGKTHWSYHIVGIAEKLKIKSYYVVPRRDLAMEGKRLKEIIDLNSQKPQLLVIDDIDEFLLSESPSSRIRSQFVKDLQLLIDLADQKPISMVFTVTYKDRFKHNVDEAIYDKLFRNRDIENISKPYDIVGRTIVVDLDYFWNYQPIDRRVIFLAEVLQAYICYYLSRDIDLNIVMKLMDKDIWMGIASLPTLGDALSYLKMYVLPTIDSQKKPVDNYDVNFSYISCISELLKHKESFDSMPTRDRLYRVVRNIAIALANVYECRYDFDTRIPPGAKSGWVKLPAAILCKNIKIGFLVPQIDRSYYITRRNELVDKILKLLENKYLDKVVLLIPIQSIKSARSLALDPKLQEYIRLGKVVITYLEPDSHSLLLSDLYAEPCWRFSDQIKNRILDEIRSLEDVWNIRVELL
ncbi:MAG TPA: hypothetical protein ENF93_00285 [Ignisphaera sp.]|nr:hypothetical protein [Ignisphaera sp.]